MLFCLLALGIVAVSRSFNVFSREVGPREKGTDWNPTKVYLLPFLVAIAASMITGLFSVNGFDAAYPARIITAGLVLIIYRGFLLRNNPLSFSCFSWEVVLAGVAVAVLWIAIDHLFTSGSIQQMPPELSAMSLFNRILWIIFKVFGSCLIIPIIEELAFRGFLLRRLIQADFTEVSYRKFTWLSFFLSSVAFGLMHGDRWIAGILSGMVYCLVMYRKGRLIDAIAAHAVSNIVIAMYVLFLGKWEFWY